MALGALADLVVGGCAVGGLLDEDAAPGLRSEGFAEGGQGGIRPDFDHGDAGLMDGGGFEGVGDAGGDLTRVVRVGGQRRGQFVCVATLAGQGMQAKFLRDYPQK